MTPSKKIVTVVGARPQFIKSAPLSRLLAESDFDEILIHTGQHYDAKMSSVFFDELSLKPPHVHLNVGSGRHGEQVAKMLMGIEKELLREKPHAVLVYGDTNSTLAGALAAAKLNIPLAHIEAGLRSFNRRMPEEINRVLTDHASDILFCPTKTAYVNLVREGINSQDLYQVGDVMLDAIRAFSNVAQARSNLLAELDLAGAPYVLLTLHRAENTDDPQCLAAILNAFLDLSTEIQIVFPVHPRTLKAVQRLEIDLRGHSGFHAIDPLSYLDMLALEKSARLIATDSGGVQKEAFFQGVPCVTLRSETEWTELVELGWNTIVPPTDARSISTALRKALAAKSPTASGENPYGDGEAARHILEILEQRLM